MSSLPTLVISLPEESLRREKISAHLQERGFDFQFFDAIDGRQMDVFAHPAYDAPRRRAAHGRDLKPGELGCMLSHRAAYQYIADQGYEHALLLEDDARLAPETKGVLEAFIAKNIDYDIVRLLGSPKVAASPHRKIFPLYTSPSEGKTPSISPSPSKGEGRGGGQIFHLTRMKTTPGGAHATLISRAGAQKLLKITETFAFPIDTILGRCWETGLNAYSVQPGLATQDLSFDSAIGEERHDKTLHLSPLEKFSFKFTRPLFKLEEALGKRKQFIATAKPDLALTKKFG